MKINLYTWLSCAERNHDKKIIEVSEGTTVEQMLKQYEKEYNFPSITEETKDMIILVNESLSKLSNELKDDDIVRVFEPCRGG